MRPHFAPLLAAFLAAVLARAVPAEARQSGSDSLEIQEEARDAQAAFERLRVRHLPWGRPLPRSADDEVVGRFVLLDDGDDRWRPPPEADAVVRGREELLAALDRAAVRLPGDGWIAGTQVRYLIEAGRPGDAILRATGCRAERWWCEALSGYARHAAGDFAGAETAFERALSLMPGDHRARWLDLELLLDGEAARIYRGLGRGAREAFARRLWWLADPLWSVPGNDRLTEHFARHVLDRVQEGARSPFGVRWGEDLREILIRYGWPAGWEKVRPRSGALASGTQPSIVGRDAPTERRVLPSFEAIAAPAEIPPGEWPLGDDDDARTTYAPHYAAARFVDLEHQLAVFRREESAFLVAGWDLTRDSLPEGAAVEAALVVAAHPDAEPLFARVVSSGPRGTTTLSVPWGPAIVSVEAVAPGARIAGRARYGLPLRGAVADRPAVSDLLLTRPGWLPTSLAAAIPLARGSVRVRPGERIGLYWEVYPPAGGPHEAEFSVGLRDERGGFWRGLRTALGLVDELGGDVALEWSEVVPAGGAYPRAVALTLPDLAPGDYALELTVRFSDAPSARSARGIVVEE